MIKFYIDKSQVIKNDTQKLCTFDRSIFHIITKKPTKGTQEKITQYYSWLTEADSDYSNHIKIIKQSGYPAMGSTRNEILASELAVVEKARGMFVQSLSSFEKNVTDIESSLNFRLSTCLALMAIVISLLGSL